MPIAIFLLLATSLTSLVANPDDRTKAQEGPAGKPNHPEADDDDEEGKTQAQTPVVITARRLDVARTQIDPELGSTVYSLGNEAIDDRPGGETSSMAVMLAQTPGVGLSGDALTVRGSKGVQVRINNVIVPEAVADPADHLSIRLAQTTRVMTGALPAQYGFVPGGVISVTTKNGLYRHGGELEFYAGSHAFIEPAVEWAGSIAGTSIFASGSLQSVRSEVADADRNWASNRSHEHEGLAFIDRILGPNDRVSLIFGGSHEHNAIGATTLPSGTEDSGDQYAVATYQHTAGTLTFQSSLFAGSGADEASFLESSREHRATFGVQLDASYNSGNANVVRAGLLASRSTAHEGNGAAPEFNAHRNSLGLYLQDEWMLTRTITFNPGIRMDWLRNIDATAEIEPRASIVWIPYEGITAHISYARYASAGPLDDERRSAAAPNERDDYIDGGVQYRLNALTLGIDAYSRTTQNLITERQIIGSALAEGFEFRNARFVGLELSATYATKPLSAWANLSVSRARGRGIEAEPSLFPLAILNAADDWVHLSSERPISASAGITWRSGKLALSATMNAASGVPGTLDVFHPNGRRTRPYATVGLSAVYHAGLGGRLSDFRFDITDLGNAHYTINDASNVEGGWTRRAPGRSITVGIEQGF